MKFYLPVIVASFLVSSLPCITKEVGGIAPAITLKDENGQTWNSSDFLDKKNILIFFYPAAMTGGCTKQACSYRDDIDKWKLRDFEVVGISGDKSANLRLFKKAYGLNFKLLSDQDGKTAQAFGVPTSQGGAIQKFFQGERFTLERGVTAKRWTFIISKEGKILYRNNKVNAGKDSDDALEFISKL